MVFCIALVVFICMLSLLDAPEYVHCFHIGICEFLEVIGDLSNNQKFKMLAETIKELPNQVFFPKNHLRQPPYIYPCLKPLDYWAGLIQNQHVRHLLQFLYRCTGPSYKLIFSFIKMDSKIPEHKKQAPPLVKSSLHLPILQFISISIIKS
ncbi:MAG: hypothetical protein ACFFDN_36675 [Candidatus Hodarchaeota archaeon]